MIEPCADERDIKHLYLMSWDFVDFGHFSVQIFKETLNDEITNTRR